ncbi:phage protein NinX family protein [Proteus mirabilis]|uniref:phage protein NinX family protein n=1 Tax=Proteus mirabilis TaxID=584 RepID=UPI003556DBE0
MTEFEINKAVAEKLGLKFKCSKSLGYITVLGTIFDPCNNVEQAWEIMMKHNICVTRGDNGLYDAFSDLYCECSTLFDYDEYVSHEKPLASAMLCFLEMDK